MVLYVSFTPSSGGMWSGRFGAKLLPPSKLVISTMKTGRFITHINVGLSTCLCEYTALTIVRY